VWRKWGAKSGRGGSLQYGLLNAEAVIASYPPGILEWAFTTSTLNFSDFSEQITCLFSANAVFAGIYGSHRYASGPTGTSTCTLQSSQVDSKNRTLKSLTTGKTSPNFCAGVLQRANSQLDGGDELRQAFILQLTFCNTCSLMFPGSPAMDLFRNSERVSDCKETKYTYHA
jgi:hypothetical protein